MSTFFRLLIPRRFHDAMLLAARSELPLECCGLLAGRVAAGVGRVIEHYPLVNALASPWEYESEPASMFRAVRDMRRRGIDILAVYHSHPTSPPIPSRLDLERRYSNDVVHLIISLATAPPELRGWWLTETSWREAEWDIEEEAGQQGGPAVDRA